MTDRKRTIHPPHIREVRTGQESRTILLNEAQYIFTTPFFVNIQYANGYFVERYLRFDLFNFQFPFDRLAVRD